jgi:ketosteroid isomerase-like protein
MKKLFFLSLASYAFFSCSESAGTKDTAAPFNLDSAKTAVEASNKAFLNAIKTSDSVAFVSVYTTDACIMPEGMPKMCGAEGIGGFFSWSKQGGMNGLSFHVTEITGGNDLISEEGTYEAAGADGKIMDKGKYLTTWKQENGKWKKYRDIWNSDMSHEPAAKK